MPSKLANQMEDMFSREMLSRGRAYINYGLLKHVLVKDMRSDGYPAKLFFNPERVHSVMADVSEQALKERVCFLCPAGLDPTQLTSPWQDSQGIEYAIRVNPFPIFDRHYTISSSHHERQQIMPHLRSMLELCAEWQQMTVFYNGPKCGASAPDHMHFQAIPRHRLPIEDHFASNYVPATYLIEESDMEQQMRTINDLVAQAPIHAGEYEPRLNMVSWYEDETYHTVVFFRQESRPACFFATGDEQILISPATVEMAGIGIVSCREAFDRLTPEKFKAILQEVAMQESTISQNTHY